MYPRSSCKVYMPKRKETWNKRWTGFVSVAIQYSSLDDESRKSRQQCVAYYVKHSIYRIVYSLRVIIIY